MLAERRKTRQIRVGDVAVGGDAPISVQSMTTTKTADVNATLQQIASLVAAGVDIVRVHDVRENVRAARMADAVVRREDGT